MFLRKSRLSCFLVLGFLLLCCCADSDSVPGYIVIKNDILDKEFNSFTVSQVVASQGTTSFNVLLKPHKKVRIPFKKVKSMKFRRCYEDFSRVYIVSCPPAEDQTMVIKLIDVHTNRLPGGCKLTRRGIEEAGGVITWEKAKK